MKIEKYRMGRMGEQENYGIYDFFKYSDEQYRLKCAFVIDDGCFILSSCSANGRDHNVLLDEIASECRIDKVRNFGGSLGQDIEFIFESENITDTDIQTIIEVLQELKMYYLDTNIDKSITIMIRALQNIDINSNNYCCKDIDTIIGKLENLKQNRGLK